MARGLPVPRTVAIRRVRPSEWPAYRRLRLRALRTDPLAFGSTWVRERRFSPRAWRERLGRPASATWAARDAAGRFVGGSVAARVDGAYHLFALWVAPAHRRHGIGGALVDRALAWVGRRARAAPVWLEVNPCQGSAVRLYRSRGFRPTGPTSRLTHAPEERVLEMRRPARRRSRRPGRRVGA